MAWTRSARCRGCVATFSASWMPGDGVRAQLEQILPRLGWPAHRRRGAPAISWDWRGRGDEAHRRRRAGRPACGRPLRPGRWRRRRRGRQCGRCLGCGAPHAGAAVGQMRLEVRQIVGRADAGECQRQTVHVAVAGARDQIAHARKRSVLADEAERLDHELPDQSGSSRRRRRAADRRPRAGAAGRGRAPSRPVSPDRSDRVRRPALATDPAAAEPPR